MGKTRVALFGGVYNNWVALEAAIHHAENRGVDGLFCLGDLGAFGPHPDKVFPLLFDHQVQVVQGNYDHSIGNDLNDCQCGYTDPRDNYFAQISYEYTYEKTHPSNRRWLRELPSEIRLEIEGKQILVCHGSPRKTNEFLWESTTSTHFLEKLTRDFECDLICGTHTGLHWKRELSNGGSFVNVGVLGRPENDGKRNVWYTLLTVSEGEFEVEFVPLEYDYQRLIAEMKAEKLPPEFIETIETGWWTTCLEVLPGRERRTGRF
ncbi:Calcineurin-like phosphoesterase superfamily domain protein [Thalassoglobus neptunius]|uniref:Calcineurin-like phosphoesterase superfamily domain protein n=1 Tax=Thalassoglobus neptunius TaxID=1938619 RepID=A0A5C5WIG3_9PLAN|nr:metallophosphoesterase family protein [Thalassoglobus neptunius]TWT49813.1 Calcineurin-like phosphoesterase superfamily domain protein [Thalassoglobus neptunius]